MKYWTTDNLRINVHSGREVLQQQIIVDGDERFYHKWVDIEVVDVDTISENIVLRDSNTVQWNPSYNYQLSDDRFRD